MLHARLEVAQILDLFQVRAVITEYSNDADPVVWVSENVTLELPDDVMDEDALSIVIRLIGLWSESTNSN